MQHVKHYLEDICQIINTNSPAQLKMFVLRHLNTHPGLRPLLNLNRAELKLFLHYLRKEVLPKIKQDLNDISEDHH